MLKRNAHFLMEREGGQAALSDIEENPFLFEELLGCVQALSRWFLPLYGKKHNGKKRMSQRFPFPFPFIPWGFSLCWFFTVSSMDKITQAASVALAIAFSLTIIGSHTKLS